MSTFPLLFILFFCLVSSDCFTTNGSHHWQEQQSLLAFKSSLTFSPNHSLSNWTVDIPFCKWGGVICDRQQDRVLFLNLSGMGLQGSISSHLANMSFLETIDLSANALHGSIPPLLGSLSQLKYLSLRGNRLGGAIPSSFVGLSTLVHLDLGHNMLSGQIPKHIANLTNLSLLDFSVNHLNGTIPSLKGLENLERLFLQKNQYVGTIPDDFGKLEHLHLLKISHNKLSGRIPQSIGNLRGLKRLFLHHNHLSDMIPVSLGYCKKLLVLDLSHNSLIGSIPQEVVNLSNIKFYLNLSFNYLEGAVPQGIGKLVKAQAVDISHNRLSGVIPETLGNCTALQYLNLSRNGFEGSVPYSLGNLKNLRYLDLSSNFLSGRIPLSLKMLKFLHSLNLSFNCLALDKDEGRSFVNGTAVISLIGNDGLFGSNVSSSLPACGRQDSFMGTPPLRKVMREVAAGAFGITAFVYLLGYVWTKRLDIRTVRLWLLEHMKRKRLQISLEEIERATDGFSNVNLLGKGNFGSVYKGKLDDGSVVAVKVLNWRARKNFTAECMALRNLRHRNVVKIITTCSTDTFKGLIFEFMCNGSLEMYLHPPNHPVRELGLKERLNIALDVARAIEYLHHQWGWPIVHRDIKPSNVLLNEDLVAHLSDFGIAKSMDYSTSSDLIGTVGYIAPEYGLVGSVSTRGDVYSYGILLLEMLTAKRPTNHMFKGHLSLRMWVKNAFQDQRFDVVDQRLGVNIICDDNPNVVTFPIVVELLRIGLWCSEDSPSARPTMAEVSRLLEIIKLEWETGTSHKIKNRPISDLLGALPLKYSDLYALS